MTSSNGNISRITGHLCGEFTGPGEFPAQRSVMQSFDVFFDLRLNKRLGEAGDLISYRGHYDVIVMMNVSTSSVHVPEIQYNLRWKFLASAHAPRCQTWLCVNI